MIENGVFLCINCRAVVIFEEKWIRPMYQERDGSLAYAGDEIRCRYCGHWSVLPDDWNEPEEEWNI